MKLAYCTPTSCSPASYRNDLDGLFASPAFSALAPFFDFSRAPAATARVPVDVTTSDTAYTVTLELPGVKKEDLKLDLAQRTLAISAERKVVVDGTETTRSYTRSLNLPDDVATEEVAAKLEDGILTLTLPKAAEARSRSIPLS